MLAAVTPRSPARSPDRALLVISLAVLLASSTWFSGTAVVPTLAAAWDLDGAEAARLTSSVQIGFLVGTLLYSVANLADVFNARWVFFASALLGSLANAGFAWVSNDLGTAVAFRFATGVTLAGVYPVGMKLVATWFDKGLGWRLGVMVGALTLGTALPYLLAVVGTTSDWRVVVSGASLAAAVGGALVALAIGDGPFLRARARFDLRMVVRVFGHRPFRNSALAYFGHMWELYAVWALSGFFLADALQDDGAWSTRAPLLAFVLVASGTVGCVVGGLASRRVGEKRVAAVSLAVSFSMCVASPWIHGAAPWLVVTAVIVWGIFVVADSPQFSALAARHAPPEYIGTALTVVNGLGFLVTVGSLQLLPALAEQHGWRWALLALAIGPLAGLGFLAGVPDRHRTDTN